MTEELIPIYDGSLEIGMKPLNLYFQLGQDNAELVFGIREPRTIIKQIKWWFVQKIFPFKIRTWDNLKE